MAKILYKGKDKWVMLTNGTNIFQPFYGKKGTGDLTKEPPGTMCYHEESLLVIEAKTQEELFNKVFIDPKKHEEDEMTGLEYHVGCCHPRNMSELTAAAVKVRARDKDGKFAKDDPLTPDYNEAWVGGKAPGEE